jgi:2-oxoglutarate dehydrogenase E1 component
MPSLDAILRANPDYVDSLYRQFLEDPESVDPTWALFFAGFQWKGDGVGAENGTDRAATETGNGRPIELTSSGAIPEGVAPTEAAHLRCYDLVHTYREFGHLIAELDPLGRGSREHPVLALSEFGFTEADLDQIVECSAYKGLQKGTLAEFLEALKATYCGTIGVEYMDVADTDEREWLQTRMEPDRNDPKLSPEQKRAVLRQLLAADTFEETLQRRFPVAKRFSLEGGTTLIPLLTTIVEQASASGVDELVMGMAHRGRLNVLAHVLGKPYEHLLAEFEDRPMPAEAQGYGDVKYHLGYSNDYQTSSGRNVHLGLAFNPSHLEAVNPIVQGNVRAKQQVFDDAERRRAIPVLIHGDAAFVAQGVVAETLMLSRLDAYRTGGTIHVIINNQVGFTTDPDEGRSTRYASDIAKTVHAPVFHVNGDDPEAVVHAARLAVGYRQEFRRDVVIDLICYRRYGHNELDDPTFTQPLMYELVKPHPSNSTVYATDLIAGGVTTQEEVDSIRSELVAELDTAHSAAQELPEQPLHKLGGIWKGLSMSSGDASSETVVAREMLERVARGLTTVPDGFNWHRRLKKLMQARAGMVLEDRDIDWGCGEVLAIGSLLLEGTPVRFSGQDTGRGTFSHRHSIYIDQKSGEPYVPLNHLDPQQNLLHMINSPLSELAALGFEYGYSAADPWTLVVWEAQFGDFVNGAQVVIDQFLASGEHKWRRMSGLVMLLPHGYEGQGPEHSSARLERFLELCAEDNIQVCNLTTPAQLFHALRRQIRRDFRKPLIIMSPKSLLRHKRAVSRISDFTDRGFQEILDEVELANQQAVRRLLVCSGKIYYSLIEMRRARLIEDTAIVRVEQLYPFPSRALRHLVASYSNVQQVTWVQEEPENMGAWRNIRHRLEENLPASVRLSYAGRPEAPSPATGMHTVHETEEQTLIDQALGE